MVRALPIRIMLADDHKLFIDGLCGLLVGENDFEVIGKATNGKEVLHKLNTSIPDVLIMDLNMPIMDGEATAEKIVKLFPSVKIVILSMYSTTTLDCRLKEIGVKGYLPKDCDSELLFSVIRLISIGESYFKNLENLSHHQNQFSELDLFLKKHNLTHRELEILNLIGKNNSSQQIATTLGISLFTVDTHRKNMLQKLNVNKKNGLWEFALANNL